MEAGKIEELKTLVERCKQNPSVLHTPSLAFFKNFLQSTGAQIPETEQSVSPSPFSFPQLAMNQKIPTVAGKDDEDIVESDVELDNSDVVEPDNDPPHKMGDPSVEVTEQNQEVAQLLKAGAMDAISHGMFDEAIEHLTKAITSNPKSAILYANRAGVFVKLKKPNAAIRDADAALQINPDSAKGYKARGMARAMLGLWEEAVSDLRVASKLDFDEEIGSVLKRVEPNANKIDEHRRKYKRLRNEKELRKIECERQRRQESEGASVLKDGQVIGIHSTTELKEKLNAASKTSRLAVLYFTATWCGPCRYIAPVFSGLAEKYPKVVFLKVDIDEEPHAAAEYNVSSVPCFFFVKNGQEVDKFVGADKNSLEMKVAHHAV
ncbi:tpr repeat-containing thioredoxin tdx [Phtheirospermum japonicum]|uniref:TPR repeat-containing thioredoxin TDX n=1 Tax=Phtheirospermum japonicum TaxID=374723 RepID=A0A830BCM9_9LAMI|nr:tpr repeat-containing thioredoxin tdx [Phtheirospermum japonicum]